MKLIIVKSNLKDGIAVVQGGSIENLNLPILRNLLLETTSNKIKITTTNLELGLSFILNGKIIEEGKTAVPVALLSSVINNLQSERLNLEKKNNGLHIITDNYEATIQGLPPEDFPLIPKIKNELESFVLSSEILKEALSQVITASQINDLRPELNSILFDFSLDAIKIVATDSFRLAEKTIGNTRFKSKEGESFRVLIPLKTAQEIARILKDEEEVSIYRDEHQILFKTDQWECISRLTEGTFPDYLPIIPKKFASEIILNRQEFINALKLAGVFGSQVNEVKIKTHESKKAIEIFSMSQTAGENRYMLSAKVQGEVKEVGFNWRYLIDGLKALKTEDVSFRLNEDNKPALLKSPGDASYFYILMPVLRT